MIIAWDTETCPQRLTDFTDRQKRRYEKLLARQLENTPDMPEAEASRLVRSVNPFLGWISCISVVRYDEKTEQIAEPKSYTAGLQTEESALLSAFWIDLKKLPGMVRWVTFNGKKFDVEFLQTRTLYHNVRPIRCDILKRNPYQHVPHTDLYNLFRNPVGLADLCDLLNVESPKSDMDGGGVYEAVKNGKIDQVAAYCERDVVATLQCYLKSRHLFL